VPVPDHRAPVQLHMYRQLQQLHSPAVHHHVRRGPVHDHDLPHTRGRMSPSDALMTLPCATFECQTYMESESDSMPFYTFTSFLREWAPTRQSPTA
jgi:hypothetical protein